MGAATAVRHTAANLLQHNTAGAGERNTPTRFSCDLPENFTICNQLISALMICQGIDSLSLDVGMGLTPAIAYWLFYSLFRTAAHGLHHVHLNDFTFMEEDLQAVADLFEVKNPPALLYDEDKWGTPPALQGDSLLIPKRVLVEKRSHLSLNNRRTRLRDAVELEKRTWFDVIHESTDYIDVLVPAYGHCRVSATAVLRADTSGRGFAAASHNIKPLTLSIFDCESDEEKYRSSIGILEFVGHPIQQLSITGYCANVADVLTHIPRVCPQLKSLQLKVFSLSSMMMIVDAFDSGQLALAPLELQRGRILEPQSIIDFLKVLADPSRKISKILRELVLGIELGSRHVNKVSQCLQELKATNDTLETLAIFVQPHENIDAILACVEPLRSHFIVNRGDPLPVANKCAFLSVVEQAQANNTALGRLDSSLVSHILTLAQTPLRRQLAVRRISN